MKTPSSFAFALVLAIVLGSLSTIPARGQDAPKVVLLQQFPLAPFAKPSSLMSGERACPFFLWTKAFTSEQRLGFNYVDQTGTARSNTPALADVTIVIDPKDSTPVATTDSPIEQNEKVWQISMSQEAYNANANCLGGIQIKSAR
jgi:hypothetical protein